MDKQIIKQLAEMSIAQESIPHEVQQFVLTRLSRHDLKQYLFYLRESLRKQKVRVKTAHPPDAAIKSRLGGMFKGKDIHYDIAPAYGAGLQVEYGDNILNLHVQNSIERIIHQLKETL